MFSNSNAHLYGYGVFTTVRINSGAPWLWEKHWRRLVRDAAAVSLDLSALTENKVRNALDERLSDGDVLNGRARLSLFDARPSQLWPSDDDRREATRFEVLTQGHRPVPAALRLTVSPFHIHSRSPLAGIKSCNYLEPLLAKEEAEKRGFHEAVRVNEHGHMVGTCMANVFWEKGGTIFTPALSTGCLPGTTREYVLENINCEEVEAEIGEIESADAMFLTSAGLGIVHVAQFDERKLTRHGQPIQDLWPPKP